MREKSPSTVRVMTWNIHGTVGGNPRFDLAGVVELIRRWAHTLADHVTLARVPGAIHDVFLSREPVRLAAYDEVTRWTDAYVT